jgi:hypothetical protein
MTTPAAPLPAYEPLRRWVLDELADTRRRLADGVIGRIPADRRHETADHDDVSPAAVLWHLSRHHDVAVNGVLRDRDQVVLRWTERLGVHDRLHRGLAERADTDLVGSLDPDAVGAYALAVIDDTIAWLDAATLDDLDDVPDSHRALAALGAPADDFDWLYAMWEGRPRRWFLSWEAIGHVVTHTGELVAIRNRMGLSPF